MGKMDCFEQAPKEMHSFFAMVGRKYLITFVDQNFIRVTADLTALAYKMRPDESMVLQFTHRPPLYPRQPIRASVAQGPTGLWAELPPKLGAWAPEPVMPQYDLSLEDHSGDALADPCASGVFRTSAFPDSCNAGSFEAPELAQDPDISQLNEANAVPATSAPTGAPTTPSERIPTATSRTAGVPSRTWGSRAG
mmetsp:Transcript_37932/g.84769  ORF Transcript_37932/g.84769 Transcript_37932/m.84769 type:complete len:194 (-) Transcript_37932:497-1078(-)